MKKRFNPLLYAILDRPLLGKRSITRTTRELVVGGATMIQLREPKICRAKDFITDALKIKSVLKTGPIKFIINDRPDIARVVNADGVHLGQDDMPITDAKQVLGPNKIIGISVATVREAHRAQKYGADYLAVGAIFKTATKPDASAVGLHSLKRIKKTSRLPVVAIGGINARNVAKVLDAGADGVAVISALFKGNNIKTNTQQLKKVILQTKKSN